MTLYRLDLDLTLGRLDLDLTHCSNKVEVDEVVVEIVVVVVEEVVVVVEVNWNTCPDYTLYSYLNHLPRPALKLFVRRPGSGLEKNLFT